MLFASFRTRKTYLGSFLTFILRSVALGLISVTMLALIPQLRDSDNFQISSLFSESRPQKISFSEAINRSAPAVVNIYSQKTIRHSSFLRNQNLERTSLGSGVLMRPDGHILTCLHVIQGADIILVAVAEKHELYEAQLIGSDEVTDLAVLKINAENLPTIPQHETADTQVGDLVLAIGNPYNLGQTVTQGIISATGRSELSQLNIASHRNFLQMDAALNKGNSGGALVDSNGYLVGINNANYKILDGGKPKDVPGVFFAVPYEMANQVMLDIISKGRVVRGSAGLQVQYHPINGIVVTGVERFGPASQAGIQVGDILTSVNGRADASVSDIVSMVSRSSPGTLLEIEVKRRDQTLSLVMTIGEFKFKIGQQ